LSLSLTSFYLWQVARLLLDSGAPDEVNVDSYDDSSALHWASKGGYVAVARLLLDRASANGPIEWKEGRNNPLFIACDYSQVEIVRLLLDRGVDVNTPNHIGWIPLFYACREGHLEMTRLLLDRGAFCGDYETEWYDDQAWPALWVACVAGNVDVVRLLIERGSDVNYVPSYSSGDEIEECALHLACGGSCHEDPLLVAARPEVARVLLELGATIQPSMLQANLEGSYQGLPDETGYDLRSWNGATPARRRLFAAMVGSMSTCLTRGPRRIMVQS